MTVLVDTSILIDHLRGNPEARQALRTAADSGRRVAAIGGHEGRGARWDAATRRGQDPPVAGGNRLGEPNVDEAIAEQAGALANRYLRSHPGVDPIDYIIAATAQALDADLWTTNQKHFPMFPQLTSPY